MLIYHVKDLMLKKSAQLNKKITYDQISKDTGISKITLSRLSSSKGHNARAEIIEKLCNYFNCTPNDLISIYPDKTD
ncbi:XRE family transcriptional regulator [Candidatus Magnetomorum sp. HK-1]|nr:XRE family transcriptional regulator [Candidatus Magnetomorum sp. HK-1]